MAGTYSLEVTDTIASSVGSWNDAVDCGSSFSNAKLTSDGWATQRACFGGNNPNNIAIRFTFSLVAASIRLDGGPLIAFAGLPNGWRPTSAQLAVFLKSFNGITQCFIQFDAATEQSVTLFNGNK